MKTLGLVTALLVGAVIALLIPNGGCVAVLFGWTAIAVAGVLIQIKADDVWHERAERNRRQNRPPP